MTKIASNSITSTGASARTYAVTTMTLNVELPCFYVQEGQTPAIIKEIVSSNANNPVSTIDTSAKKPSGNTRSYRCYSKHDVVYFLVGNSYHWGATTKSKYY